MGNNARGGQWGEEAGSHCLDGVPLIGNVFSSAVSEQEKVLMLGFHLAEINSWPCTKAYTVSCVCQRVSLCASVCMCSESHQGRVGGLASSPCKKSHSTLTHFPSLTNGMVAILVPVARR